MPSKPQGMSTFRGEWRPAGVSIPPGPHSESWISVLLHFAGCPYLGPTMNQRCYIRMVGVVLCAVVVLGTVWSQAANVPAGRRFQQAYQLLANADDHRDRSEFARAAQLYGDALKAYGALASQYPSWEPGVVRFRIAYCDKQREAALKKAGGAPVSPRPAVPAMRPAPSRMTPDREPYRLAPPSPEASQGAVGLMQRGQAGEAVEALLAKLRANPDDPRTRLLLGVALCQDGRYHDALYLLEELAREAPKRADARVALGTAYAGLGRMNDAIRELDKAVELAPRLASAHYDLAQLWMLTKPANVAKAKVHYQAALKLGASPDRELGMLLQ